jgi:ABC-2 type transport system ATP-binding protein
VLDEPTSGLDPLMEKEFQRCVHEASARGQTVFLSSHQLTEVDQLCTRVGILRAGRLVEIAMLDELRRLHRSEVRLTFSGAAQVPAGLADVPGVGSVRRPAPHQVVLSLAGPPAALLRALADADVTSIDVREPSLEEIFGDYYGEAST